MKPITTTNLEGRALLALRAGPMTITEINERLNSSLPGWLLKVGYVVLADSSYRLTEAGRAACPYRNPLAAPGVVQPYILKTESAMPRENTVSRQQVLQAIKDAGSAGITKGELVAKFEHLVGEPAITSHLVMLKKDGAASNPSRGYWVATVDVPAVLSSSNSAKQSLIDMAAGIDLENLQMPPEAFETIEVETIEIKGVMDRRTPTKIDVDADDLEVGVFTDGSMDFLVDDGLEDAHIKFSPAAVNKLRRFLGLFQEAA